MEPNIKSLIRHFGGVNALAQALKTHFPQDAVSAGAIYKWQNRNSLPLQQLDKLLKLSEIIGNPLDLNQIMQGNNPQTTHQIMEKTMNTSNRVIILDTTLRDGEQSPGAAMTKEEKLRVARQLERLGVDVIEAGFAAASPGDFDAIHQIAEVIKNVTVSSLARASERDVRAAGEAVLPAQKRRIHTFIATSPLHMEFKLKMNAKQVIEAAIKAVRIAKEYTDDIEFSCEDALRSDNDFLAEVCSAVIAEGATTINIPDTVGYSIPFHTEEFFRTLINKTHNGHQVIWSAHCHDDLGLSVANSLAAVRAGARQIECTINGLGERAGNASLEEVVMALKTRHDLFGLETGVDTTQIVPTSKLVSTITGYPIQPNKAIVGANAFAHESGIHQDGILKCRETYEIMSAQSVGWTTNRLTLGKLSGRSAFRQKLTEIGIELDSVEALNAAFARFKDLADKKREIFDDDLHALVSDEMINLAQEHYKYVSLRIQTETGEAPQAEIVFNVEGVEHRAISQGSGPVDAVFKAIESVCSSGAQLELYSVNAVTAGTESQGEVTVRLSRAGNIVNGQGADTDVIAASAKAYLSALNKLQFGQRKIKAQGDI